MPQPQQSQQPDPDPCVPPFITPGTSGCYYVDTTASVNFTAARSLCSDQGGLLVEIDSQEKQNEIFQYLDANPSFRTNYSWLGATDRDVEGNWVWTTSGRPITFTNWLAGEPGPGALLDVQDCTEMRRVDEAWHAGKWADTQCDNLRQPICEIGENRFTLVFLVC